MSSGHLSEMNGDCLRARLDAELLVDVPDVRVHGRIADVQAFGDFLVRLALRQRVEHLLFAQRELFVIVLRMRDVLKRQHHLSRDVSGHAQAALANVGDGPMTIATES